MAEDIIKARLVEQGYVTSKCLADTRDVVNAIDSGFDACAQCEVDRRICGGRPKVEIVADVVEGSVTPSMGQPNVYYFSGVDPAPALGKRSDDGAIAIGKIWPKSPNEKPNYFSDIPTDWNFGFVGAYRLRKMSARQWSGKIHELHSRYGFTLVAMDPGGGGAYIQMELKSHRQLILAVEREVRPLCTISDGLLDGLPILRMVKRGDQGVESMWPRLAGDDMVPDQMHTLFMDALETGGVLFPQPWDKRPGEEKRAIEREWAISDVWSLKNLSAGMGQLAKIRVLVNDKGEWIVTRRGAKQFDSIGKKDIAYSMCYTYLGFRMWLKAGMMGMGMDGGDEEWAGEVD
jgi:hypothetical protein